jgi:hypothetical protein
MMRNIYVGRTDQEARDRVVEAMDVFYHQFTAVWRLYGDVRHGAIQDFGSALEEGLLLAGSAATVRAQLTRLIGESGCNHFAGAFAFGSLSYPESRASIVRFGEEVAPALRGLSG